MFDNIGWLVEATRIFYVGNLPDSIKEKSAALGPKELKPFGGFTR